MQQEIANRQNSRRQRGLQPELRVAGAGAGAALNDAAALAAAGDETEDGKEEEEATVSQPPPPPPLGEVAETASTLKPPTFAKWDEPTRDPEALRAHIKSFTRQASRSPWYRPLLDWMTDHTDSHGITTFDEWMDPNLLTTVSLQANVRCTNG